MNMNTKRAYESDWQNFVNYCDSMGCQSLPAEDTIIVGYITQLADSHKYTTIRRHISAISQVHKRVGNDTPTQTFAVKATMDSIRHNIGTAADKKQAAVIDDIRLMVNTLDNRLIGIRDRAMLLIGFAGAFRRSELTGLTMDNIEFNRNGVTITLHTEYKKGIPYGSNEDTCPVRALQAWLNRSGITEGAIFRGIDRHGHMKDKALTAESVAIIVKRTAEAAGLDSSKYAGHSLRSGFIVTAAINGSNEYNIMRQAAVKSIGVVRDYLQEAELYGNSAAANVGL